MKAPRSDIKLRIQDALPERGASWEALVNEAEQIVAFGSWSLTEYSQSSDIDLLCIGFGKRHKKQFLDIVWLTSNEVYLKPWLGSELANHVARFGVWLHGQDTWSDKVFVSAAALDYKRLLIKSRVTMLERVWNSFDRDYQVKHVVKIRRDIQRLALMLAGQAVEPSPLLDQRWKHLGATAASLLDLLKGIDETSLLTNHQLSMMQSALIRTDWRSHAISPSSLASLNV